MFKMSLDNKDTRPRREESQSKLNSTVTQNKYGSLLPASTAFSQVALAKPFSGCATKEDALLWLMRALPAFQQTGALHLNFYPKTVFFLKKA